jgi:hypothetical protein
MPEPASGRWFTEKAAKPNGSAVAVYMLFDRSSSPGAAAA